MTKGMEVELVVTFTLSDSSQTLTAMIVSAGSSQHWAWKG